MQKTEKIFLTLFIVSIFIKCQAFQLWSGQNRLFPATRRDLLMILCTLCLIIAILAIVIFIFNRFRAPAIFAVFLLLSFMLFADTVYYRYFSSAIPAAALYQAGYVGDTSESITSLLNWKDLIFAVDIPLMTGMLIYITRKKPRRFRLTKRLLMLLIPVALGTAGIFTAYGNSPHYIFQYDNNTIIKNLGVFYYHGYDISRFIKDHFFLNRMASKDEIECFEEFYSQKHKDSEDRNKDNACYHGVAEGCNLVIVQLEAVQSFLIGKQINEQEITPNINKLIKESLYFDNFYYQIGTGNTSDAEFLCNTSLYPLTEGAVYFRFPSNKYYSLPHALKEKGYTSYAFHANNPSFWNRTNMYGSLGFDKFISSEDYTIDEVLGWGLSDISFFRQSFDHIDVSNPFYAFMITLSTHHAYRSFDNYYFNVNPYADDIFGRYIKAVNYADKALGVLLQELKDRGLYDNTMIVIYGDHFGLAENQMQKAFEFLDSDNNHFEFMKLQKTPLIIKYPGLNEGKVISTICGEIDLMPTIANLMGFDAPYALGDDILNTDKGYVILPNNTIITDDFIYSAASGLTYSTGTGRVCDTHNERQTKDLQQKLKISQLIIFKDMFRHIDIFKDE